MSDLEGRLRHAYGATSRASIPSRLCPLCKYGHALCKSPTSLREVPHLCLISMSSRHKCTTTTTSSGRGVPCTQVLATKPCRCQANIGYKASPWPEVKIPKADNTWDGHCPSKAPFCGNTIYLSALEGRLSYAYGAMSQASIPSRLCPLCECGHALCKSPTSLREAPHLCLISMTQGISVPLLPTYALSSCL